MISALLIILKWITQCMLDLSLCTHRAVVGFVRKLLRDVAPRFGKTRV